MGVTGSYDETIIVSVSDEVEEPDFPGPVADAELTTALDAATRPLAPEERVEVDISGDDAFGV